MNQEERRLYLIQYLCKEMDIHIRIPKEIEAQKQLLRALMNVRMPHPIGDDVLQIQDAYLQEAIKEKGIATLKDCTQMSKQIYVWKGDITTLCVDAIVNAANSQMLGCFVPNHKCIDNAIHTYAGMQLRNACQQMMQGQQEPVGKARITQAYNLPSKYVIHTVGPYIATSVTDQEIEQLKSCYLECLELADSYHLNTIAFCCISTGEFHFPNALATEIACQTVQEYLKHSQLEVIFNVFKEEDNQLYRQYFKIKQSNQ